MDHIEQVFGEAGLLAKRFAGYTPREGQVALSRKIDQAIGFGEHLLAEAPTGTGKSIAYLVPAIYDAKQNNRQVVVVTANIALTEQLVNKDLPLLAEILPWKFTFGLLKGKQNYLCKDKRNTLIGLREGQTRGYLELTRDAADHDRVERAIDWSGSTLTGDRSELDFEMTDRIWRELSSNADECPGRPCPDFEGCFAIEAAKKARESDVIVTNYHMLMLHLRSGEEFILPKLETVILDEAHEVPDIARSVMGEDFGYFAFKRAVDPLGRSHPAAHTLLSSAQNLFDVLLAYRRSGQYRNRIRHSLLAGHGQVAQAWIGLKGSLVYAQSALSKAAAEASGAANSGDPKARKLEGRCVQSVARLQELERVGADILAGSPVDEGGIRKVSFIEETERQQARLVQRIVDVGPILNSSLFSKARSVIAVSATLMVGESFDWIRDEMGAPSDTDTFWCESPFDWQRQAMLIVPKGLPDPREEEDEYDEAVARCVRETIDIAEGRSLVLFTSYKAMRRCADHALIKKCKHRILIQGEMSKSRLGSEFKQDVGSVLFALRTFWQGIDVPGESLSVVVLDKLPFPHPGDPILDVLCESDSKSGFFKHMVPRAVIMFRQGVGRLIRSHTDKGAVVVLDRRIMTKGYGRTFIKSLPYIMRTDDLDDLKGFLPPSRCAHVAPKADDWSESAEDGSQYTDADIPF